MRPHIEGLAEGIALAFAAVSGWVWISIIRVWRRDGQVLPLEPRRPVPWGPAGLLIAAFFLLNQLLGFLSDDGSELSPDQATTVLFQWAAFEVLATLVGILLLRRVSRANWHDLGLPESLQHGAADVLLGMRSFLASLAPVYLVLQMFIWIFGPRPQHPLLEELSQEPSLALFSATAISAVIAAPLFEEFVYRLLIQGWLEKEVVPASSGTTRRDSPRGTPERGGDAATALDEPVTLTDLASDIARHSEENTAEEPVAPPNSESTVWLPIVVSSLLFAAAHVGYGYSPVPLFLLGLILGYVYQRTHRILPCVVTHMAFNGLSVAVTGLETFGKALPMPA